jgi:hypothetical protein
MYDADCNLQAVAISDMFNLYSLHEVQEIFCKKVR